MRATIVLILLLIITGTAACGGANNHHGVVAVMTTASLPPNELAATRRPATEFAGMNTTRVEYRLVLNPTVATTATVTQIIKNEETGDTGYVEQLLTPVDKTRREYWIARPPSMRHIVFYIEGDDNGADSFRVFDGDREITFLPRGTFHGRSIWTIEETSSIANN